MHLKLDWEDDHDKTSRCEYIFFGLLLTGCWQKDVGRSYYQPWKIMTEVTLRNGMLDGPAAMFYESGAKMSEANYREGFLDGKSILYYQNGRMKSTAIYKDGYLNRPSVEWSETGLVIAEADIKLGKVVGKIKND